MHDAPDDEGACAIVKAIVSLGRELDLLVIAEGVETRSQFALLRSLGCGRAQGFLFSPPLPAATLRELMKGQGAVVQQATQHAYQA
jgi:EAL domain-containing protein (putative c-di-GMP-specific phosphodiesterase class I)